MESPSRWTVVPSPVDDLLLVDDGEGRLTGLYCAPTDPPPDGVRDDRAFDDVVAQLEAYFAGELRAFDVPLAPRGTPFQHEVWAALRRIPYGETTTYGAIATELGRPLGASRAVGAANGRNPISILVPCHRVVGASGMLTGYAGGVPRKERLLALERGDTLF